MRLHNDPFPGTPPVFALAFRHDARSIYGRIIARVAGGPVHVAVVFGPSAYEAMEGHGVRMVPTVTLLEHGDWTVVPVPFGDVSKALAFARRELGARYDWWGVLWSWMVGRWGGNGSAARWFCSEYAVAVVVASGITLAVARFAFYTPARLWRVVRLWRRHAWRCTNGTWEAVTDDA